MARSTRSPCRRRLSSQVDGRVHTSQHASAFMVIVPERLPITVEGLMFGEHERIRVAPALAHSDNYGISYVSSQLARSR